MSDAVLQKAIECLRVSDIWQREASAQLSEYLDELGDLPERHDVLFKHVVLRSLWGKSEETEEAPYVFKVQVGLGARFVESAKSSKGDGEPDIKSAPMLAQIECVYVAEYLSEIDPGSDALKAFALENASYHIWPYWREYLATQCFRMNLPKVNLPLRSFASNQAANPK